MPHITNYSSVIYIHAFSKIIIDFFIYIFEIAVCSFKKICTYICDV